ncbi:MAG: FecR domain-containing protein [Vitreimonas sp.]
MSERRLSGAELEASRWIARLEASDVTLADHQRFREWLAASPENRAAHEALSRAWDKLDGLKLLSPRPSTTPQRPPLSRRALLLGAGGALAIAGSATVAFWALMPATTFAATYQTAIGGREEATLQDGSRIALNADTRVRATFTARSRTVHLERGEALFTVTADARPFEVQTPFGSLIAEGTVFLVKLGATSVRASVIEGHVTALASRNASKQAGANEELTLSHEAVTQSAMPAESAARRLAWRDHMLAFDGETLAEAAGDVERQTGVRFEFASNEIAQRRIGGYIDARDAGAFISLVESNLSLSAQRQANGAVLITN